MLLYRKGGMVMAELITLDRFHSKQAGYHINFLQKSSMDQKNHYHDYYQVCYVVSGALTHRQEGTALILGAGDAFIVPPGFIHSLHFNNDRTRMYSLAFSTVRPLICSRAASC